MPNGQTKIVATLRGKDAYGLFTRHRFLGAAHSVALKFGRIQDTGYFPVG